MSSLLLLPPLLIDLLLFALFARGLLPGRKAILTALARYARGHVLDAKTIGYTRQVTLIWTLSTGAFALLIAPGLVVTAWRPIALGAALTQGLFYLALLAIEHRVRRRYLDHLEHRGFLDFLRLLRRVDYAAVLRE